MHVVYGGAFNPPTKAHQKIPEILMRKLPITKFTYLPVSTVYKKENLLANHHRYNMLQLMSEPMKNVGVSDLEINDRSFLGTYHTLKRLKQGDEPLAFVIGSDHLKTLKTWIKADCLLKEFYCIVLNRNALDMAAMVEKDAYLKAHKDKLILCEDIDLPYASSDYRTTKDASLLPDVVNDYIKKHQLYEG